VQTTCPHCRSVVVRRDVDLEAVGQVADLPLTPSPIQIGTRGRFEGDAFTVTGRIVYEYEHGTWNEWHLWFMDGSSGWLSDAQAEYAVSRRAEVTRPLPEARTLEPGQRFQWDDVPFTVTTLTEARYRGVEGELPFEYWDKDAVLFADLRSADGHFATIDYSESPPLLFVGVYVPFDDLELTDLRPEGGGPAVEAAGFNCRNCGAAIELKAVGGTATVACTSCAAIQDPDDPNVLILQQAAERQRHTPKIPLGSSGTLHGHRYEAIGFQHRSIVVEGERYGWDEYLLYNREQGYRYLSEYQGHWNDITTLRAVPLETKVRGHFAARYLGNTFKLFQTATATTDYVIGQFPWRVRAGDVATVSDFVAPPLLLSAERTPEETTWSLGEYTPGTTIWKAFGLEGRPPRPVGIFANQPSPHAGRTAWYWGLFVMLLLLVGAAGLLRLMTADREQLYRARHAFVPGTPEASYVTPEFELREASNVSIEIDTNLSNNWTYFNLALIETASGRALDFGREVSYYSGVDSDGRWTEGSTRESVTLPTQEPGRYYLRVEPEGTAGSPAVTYTLTVRRDVPMPMYYAIAIVLLAIPPVLASVRAASFEGRRWQESDYGE
jgi:hypothetical protein